MSDDCVYEIIDAWGERVSESDGRTNYYIYNQHD